MREVKFRALLANGVQITNNKRLQPGEWYLWDAVNAAHFVISNIIDTRTLGQYIGLKDKNGRDIYEGDIVRYSANFGQYGFELWGERVAAVKYREDFNIQGGYGDWYLDGENQASFDFVPTHGVVIGNIYENPELLEARS